MERLECLESHNIQHIHCSVWNVVVMDRLQNLKKVQKKSQKAKTKQGVEDIAQRLIRPGETKESLASQIPNDDWMAQKINVLI